MFRLDSIDKAENTNFSERRDGGIFDPIQGIKWVIGRFKTGNQMVRGISVDAYLARFFSGEQVEGRSDGAQKSPGSSLTDAADSTNRLLQQRDDNSAASLSISTAARSALQVASHSELRVEGDGSLSTSNKVQLRFRYDLQTNDGQQIQLHARAKIKQSVTLDSDGEATIKTRVKLQFSLIQTDVSENVSPLLNDSADDDVNPLQTFLDAVDNAVTGFADGSTTDADSLIHDVLEEFNVLLNELSGRFADTDQTPVIESPAEVVATANEQEASDAAIATEPVALAPESTTKLLPEKLTAVDFVEESAIEETNAGDESDSIDSSPGSETSAESARGVLMDVRLRFVLSFSEVIRTLSPGSESDEVGQAVVQQNNFRLAAQVQYLSAQADGLENSTSYLA